jgi:hypothetical protein
MQQRGIVSGYRQKHTPRYFVQFIYPSKAVFFKTK